MAANRKSMGRKMGRRNVNPYACCPVCGVEVGVSLVLLHRCSQRQLAAIDAADTRHESALDPTDRPDDYMGRFGYEDRPLWLRLAEGFDLMGRAFDDDDDGDQ